MSAATNLVPNDTNGFWDIFVHDRQTGQTTRVSLSTGGAQADSHSLFPAISGDGRYVAFESIATNLVANDTNGVVDVFVHDRNGGQTTRASVSGGGAQANGGSDKPDISYYGQYVTFQSDATNLVTGDTNAARDVFVHNRINGDTTRASVSTGGVQGDNASHLPKITGNGAAVAFSSTATNLVAGDTNAVDDIFVRYLWTNQTIRVSLDSAGNQSNGGSHTPDIAGNGDWVVFASSANNLVAGDTNAVDDIFAHAPSTGVTIRSSVSTAGTQANALSSLPSTSYDGRFTAFTSSATNLVANDTNGFNDVFVRYNGEEGGFFPGDGDDDDSGCFLQTLR
jgi:Tol biopolymer transport system component